MNNTDNRPLPVSRRAFSLVELLVVIAIVSVIIAIIVPVAGGAKRRATTAKEIAAARQLMIGWTAYATDHRGRLLPGYRNGLDAEDEYGNTIGDPIAARYPWRLAPYLDYDFAGLYMDPNLQDQLNYAEGQTTQYFLSLYPALGINSVFVGGDKDYEFESLYGNFYLTRLSQPKRPAEVIVFASARTNAEFPPYNFPVTEGYFRVRAPNTFQPEWTDTWDATAPAADWGYVSLRLGTGKAAVGFIDGHASTLDEGEIRDMRHWADQADSYDWMLTQ